MRRPLEETVFLVSGGGRGVTSQCVVALARAHAGAFVLLGRTRIDRTYPFSDYTSDADLKRQIAAYLRDRAEKVTPVEIEKIFRAVTARDEIGRTLEAIAAAGGRAEYLAVDVTDRLAVREAVAASTLGQISGVIHGAGVLSDKLIEQKTERDFDLVYTTKIHGLRSMLECVDADRLSYLALFSSLAAFYGNRGQADYAVANEILNKFAHAFKRRVPSCHTTVFDWGPWDGGMVGPQLKELFQSRGVPVMPADAGARLFVETLRGGNPDVQLLVGDALMPPPAVPRSLTPLRRMSRTLSVAGNPFLRDHVINGKPVLPAACASLWMANACQQCHPGYRFFSLSNFKVLKGVVFDESLAERYVLEIRESEASEDTVTQSVMISSSTPDQKVRYHYRGEVTLRRALPAMPVYPRVDSSSDERFEACRPYDGGTLFHGPTFQAIARVLRIGQRAIAVECVPPEVPARTLGQFPAVAFSPSCMDAMFQCLGLWVHHHDQAVALPSSCEGYKVYAVPPSGQALYVSAEIESKTEYAVRASIYMHDAAGRVLAEAHGAELTIGRRVNRQAVPADPPSRTDAGAVDRASVMRKLRRLDRACYLFKTGDRVWLGHDERPAAGAGANSERLAVIPAITPAQLGAESFRRTYGVKYAYLAGAMAKGIASEDLVIALAREGALASFGAGGLSLERTERAIQRIQEALPGQPYAFNLLHSPRKLQVEDATVDLYLKYGVKTVEASSYMDLTPSIVRYRLAGLTRRGDGTIEIGHRVIVKLSRIELATRFMQPPPPPLLQRLLESRQISPLQATLAERVPMADDITVEADSGGHTDNRPLVSVLPAMLKLRDEIQRQQGYAATIRVGAAGGIATPQAVLAAFMMGADYVVTGSINQSCVEAGTSDAVKQLLAQVGMTDVAMAPESDQFERGVTVQVVKHRTLFAMRAQKLLDCYQRYGGLDEIPAPEKRQLEQQIFRDSLENIWRATVDYLSVHKPEQIARADDPKVRMALVFKWYLGQASRWAAEGTPDRRLDYQIWCGPAMGAFNDWARGSYLQTAENRRVADVARVLMSEAACLYRLQLLKLHGCSSLVSAG